MGNDLCMMMLKVDKRLISPCIVRCVTKKAVMSISPESTVDFGPGVILAETGSRSVTIANAGALDVEYTILVDDEVRGRRQEP